MTTQADDILQLAVENILNITSLVRKIGKSEKKKIHESYTIN